jgi:hypothetical protein
MLYTCESVKQEPLAKKVGQGVEHGDGLILNVTGHNVHVLGHIIVKKRVCYGQGSEYQSLSTNLMRL